MGLGSCFEVRGVKRRIQLRDRRFQRWLLQQHSLHLCRLKLHVTDRDSQDICPDGSLRLSLVRAIRITRAVLKLTKKQEDLILLNDHIFINVNFL